ncbi:unnamed protein product [Effrenium voratum]|nr:unnamed protein product [Effrenium voratum]
MGKRGGSFGGGAWGKGAWNKGKGLRGPDTTHPNAVPMPDHYALDILRPYPGEDGSILVKRQRAASDTVLVSLEGIAARLTPSNCEAMNRPATWISTVSASVTEGKKYFEYFGSPQLQEDTETICASFNEDLVAAAKILDTKKKETGDFDASIQTLLTFLSEPSVQQHQAWQRVALACAHGYTTAMNILQGMAPMQDRKRWSEQIGKQIALHPSELREFVHNFQSDACLLRGLKACFQEGGAPDATTGMSSLFNPAPAMGAPESATKAAPSTAGAFAGSSLASAPAEPALFKRKAAAEPASKSKAARTSAPVPPAVDAQPDCLQKLRNGDETMVGEVLELAGKLHHEKMQVSMEEEKLECGVLQRMANHPKFPIFPALSELLMTLDADPESVEARAELSLIQSKVLQNYVGLPDAVEAFAAGYNFCVKARINPSKDEVVHLLETIPLALRVLSNISPMAKYAKQKAHCWRQDVCRALTLACGCLKAHLQDPKEDSEGTAEEEAVERLSEGVPDAEEGDALESFAAGLQD